MERFLKRKLNLANDNKNVDGGTSRGDERENIDGGTSRRDSHPTNTNNTTHLFLRISWHEVNFDELSYDPVDRRRILD
jgi:hypothetical protein